MKSAVVEFYKGKVEIDSMDIELPLLMYVALIARIENLPAELAFAEDYLDLDASMESEKRLMTNV